MITVRRIALLVLVLLMAAMAYPTVPSLAQPGLPHAAQQDPSVRADFNRDGFADLAIGAPYEDIGSLADAGAVTVLYGTASGLSGTRSQLFTQVGGIVEAGDRFGSAVAAGDFNHDGFADLVGGAPGEDLPPRDAGALSVLYGSAAGLTTSGGRSFAVGGTSAEGGDHLGAAVAAGDFNDDGFADLAAGAPGATINGGPGAGWIYVLYGSATGPAPTGSREWFTQPGGMPESGDGFGSPLAAGDFNHDGFADLAAGAPGEAVGGLGAAGAVSVLYGSAGGLNRTGERLFTQVGGAVERGDGFGWALAAGDFNGDGFGDVVASAPGEDLGTVADTGAVSEIRGAVGGLTTPGSQLHTERSFTGPQAGDRFGSALAAGDVDKDGFTDLAVGIPFEDLTATLTDVGAVGVFFGRPQGLFATFEDQHTQVGANERGDRFGATVAAGDFTNDGSADIAAGAPSEDVGRKADGGAVSILYGPVVGLSGQVFTQDSPGVAGAAEPGDRFGGALAAADPAP
jgi:hypothetical protein